MSSPPKISPSAPSDELQSLRLQIDQLDRQLVTLLEQRASLVFSVGEFKRIHQLPLQDGTREAQILKKVQGLTNPSGPLSANEMSSLFIALIERFRSFEGVHIQRDLAMSLYTEAHLDFHKTQQVVLWGFGLLGSSFYLALGEMLPHWKFLVVDPGLEVDLFLSWKAEHQFTNIDLIHSQQMQQGNLFVLGAPVDINAQHLAEFDFPKDAVVFDLGSTKKEMMAVFQKRQALGKSSFTYVGGHPLAGKETFGFQNGDPLLFSNKIFCWTHPSSQALAPAVKTTFEILALCLGAKPYWTTAEDHDLALAWTSHLPQILSSALAASLLEKPFSPVAELFPSGIRDLLRISGSSFSMWKSIMDTNQDNLKQALSEIIQRLTEVHQNLENPSSCEQLFHQSNDFYNQFQNIKNHKRTTREPK